MPDLSNGLRVDINDLRQYEHVPGDFLFKKTGMDIVRKFVGIKSSDIVLEVGCGAGANSVILSGSVSRVVATDLPGYDAKTHSLGMKTAKDLVGKAEAANIELASCSGDMLPFRNGTFDAVFSFSVLEHIGNRKEAMKEMMRVTRPGGIVVFAVPTYIQSLCAFGHLYIYAARRVFDVAVSKIFKLGARKEKTLLPLKSDTSRASAAILGSFMDNHPSFPLPEPHGEYRDIFDEFFSQLPWKWTGLAKSCGARSVADFSYLMLPHSIIEAISSRAVAELYRLTKGAHMFFAGTPLKYFSYSYCVVAKK